MAKFQENPVQVTAFQIVSIPTDDNGNIIVDGNDNVTVQTGDPGSAGTIPYVFSAAALEGFNVGDYVVIGANGAQSLVANATFTSNYTAM